MIDVLLGIVASWITSVVSFPVVKVQHWMNSRIRVAWRFVTFRPPGLTGRWLATYELSRDSGGREKRCEIVRCDQLVGGEVRGRISDEDTRARYGFLGHIAFDELVGHYWSTDVDGRDIGSFMFRIDAQAQMLKGTLKVYDSLSKGMKSDVDYCWRRYPGWLLTRIRKVRGGRSTIDRVGLFANCRFRRHQDIGMLRLGPSEQQGQYTIRFDGRHRLVKEPWRFLNHSCSPNAKLKWRGKGVALIAAEEVLPQEELTVDYRDLQEMIGTPFVCQCPHHVGLVRPRIGA